MYENGTIMGLSIAKVGDKKVQTKLIALMKENNITNKKLAEEINVCEKQFGLKLKGKSRFKDNEMFIIANFFKKTVEEIFLPPMYENGTIEK